MWSLNKYNQLQFEVVQMGIELVLAFIVDCELSKIPSICAVRWTWIMGRFYVLVSFLSLCLARSKV